MISCLAPTGSSAPSIHRELLLALQWINFQHEPRDLYLLFSDDLYNKMATVSGMVSTRVEVDVSLPTTRLANRLRMACVLVYQLLALRVGYAIEHSIYTKEPHGIMLNTAFS